MLYVLHEYLQEYLSVFNVLRYLTFRSMMAFLMSLTLVLVLQPRFIRAIKAKSATQPIREDGPKSHNKKKGTPTMGGLVILCAVTLSSLLFAKIHPVFMFG